jgi:hypothetical protein
VEHTHNQDDFVIEPVEYAVTAISDEAHFGRNLGINRPDKGIFQQPVERALQAEQICLGYPPSEFA